jgi:hypothetical protein
MRDRDFEDLQEELDTAFGKLQEAHLAAWTIRDYFGAYGSARINGVMEAIIQCSGRSSGYVKRTGSKR